MRLRTLLLVAFLLCTTQALAADRYVSPTGTGSTCSSGTRCSLQTAQDLVQPGESIILGNGTYSTLIETQRSGTAGNIITIRAENHQQAIIQPPIDPAVYRGRVVNICHDYITVRGLKIDGRRQWHFLLTVVGSQSSQVCVNPQATVNNIMIEENWFTNGSGVFTSVQFANIVTFRWNLIENLGYFKQGMSFCCGSAFYMGSPTGGQDVNNVDIYANTIRNATNNAFDIKDPDVMDDINIHHNIIENHQHPWDHGHPYPSVSGHGYNDGLIIMHSTNSVFSRNILRNNDAGSSTFELRGGANNRIEGNVVMNAIKPSHCCNPKGNQNTPIWRSSGDGPLANSQGNDNIFCNLNSYSNHSLPPETTFSGNLLNQNVSVCEAEVTDILGERNVLDRFEAVTVAAPTVLTILSISP